MKLTVIQKPKVYYSLETLLMILDGQFYPVVRAFEDSIEIPHSLQRRTLPSYNSADFMISIAFFSSSSSAS